MNHPQEEVVYGYSEVTIMSSTAGPQLYYPTPPPPPLPPPPPRRRRRILVRAFIGVCIFMGALSLLTWLIYRPQTIQVAVSTATLSHFDLNTTATAIGDPPVLSYNLTAVLAISNPNRRVSIYYDRLEAAGLYQGERFGRAALPVSFQGPRRTDAAPAVLVGSSTVYVNADAFGEDNSTGVFPLDLWVDGVVRYKFGDLMTTTATTLTVKCHLALKLMVASGWVDCTVIDF